MSDLHLDAGRWRLRPWRLDDADAVCDAGLDPGIALWNPVPAGRADALGWLQSRMDWSANDHASLAIAGREGDLLVGSVSLHSIDPVQGDAEIGYWVSPAARGQAAAAAAVTALCRWAFASLPIERIELRHAIENPASGRVAERAGFQSEGLLRLSYRYSDGRRRDELLWSLLRTDPLPPP